VREALVERDRLTRNAPHLVRRLPLVIPSFRWWELPFYGLGMKVYGLLAGRLRWGLSEMLSRNEVLERIPGLRARDLRGGVLYHDGQFDDTRLLIHLAMTAAEQGATLLNYAPVVKFVQHASGRVDGAVFQDLETGEEHTVRTRVIINATGAFCDDLRRMAEPSAAQLVAPSQGIHLVFAEHFLGGSSALMVPRTRDGRVLFAIPWHGHTLVGTTDTPLDQLSLEPRAQGEEIEFILSTAAEYLSTPPTRADILSVFAGIRPLVKPLRGGKKVSALSRDHTIHLDPSGLLTITGGKWTTYRHMAEECVNFAATRAKLPERGCVTEALRVHGYCDGAPEHEPLRVYGADAQEIQKLAAAELGWSAPLHAEFSYLAAEVVWAAREEMARTVEDVLARRLRALFLNARAASESAPRVAALLAAELGKDAAWQQAQVEAFRSLAAGYYP
jgi:glycerol-3-phosphate dehydrogenase